MRGEKTVVITGGNAGLGFECAREVAASGPAWRVVLACRDLKGGEGAARALSGEFDGAGVEAMRLDLASLGSVRSFVGGFVSRGDLPPLGAVVCNAGLQTVGGTTYTENGFETTFGVNHLGHFLLVNLLLRRMAASSRVVFVSSGTHDPKRRTGMPAPRYRGAAALAYPGRFPDPEEQNEGAGTVGRRRYTTSKLCNVMCAYELGRRLRAGGVGISSNAFDPGAMPNTGLVREYGPATRLAWNALAGTLLPALRRFGVAASTARDSGRALARLVTDPALQDVSGGYFEIGQKALSSEESYDREKAEELWETSARLVGLRSEETILPVPTRTAGA